MKYAIATPVMLLPQSPSSQQRLTSHPLSRSSLPLHQALASHSPKRLRHAESMAQRRIQRGRPSVKHASSANYGASKAWQCTWDNNGAGPVCQKSFGRKSDLQRHHHTHTGTRNHACTFEGCGKTFIQTSALTVHMRTHTGEKPHECIVCQKRFSDSSSLARHRKIHSNERPYPCDYEYCDKSFCRKSTLHKHIERDHFQLAASRTDDEGWYDEPDHVSPITPGAASVSEVAWSAGSEGIVSPFTTTLPSQNFNTQQHQISRSPFTTVPQRGTPDPTYRHYPHPNLSMGQVQNLSSADVRGYHPAVMVSPPNLGEDHQNGISRVAEWSNNNQVTMDVSMQQAPSNVYGSQEYAPRSAPLDSYRINLQYSNVPQGMVRSQSQHRRSVSDASRAMLSQEQRRELSMQAQQSNMQVEQIRSQQMDRYQLSQGQQQSEARSHQVKQEQGYIHPPMEYTQQQAQQMMSQAHPVYNQVEAMSYDNDNYEDYQEPQVQDIGVVSGQTYGLPIGYDLGISAVELDDKYADTFGEAFPSQYLQ